MKKIIYTNAFGDSIEFGCDGGTLTLEDIDANSLGMTVSASKNAGQDGQTTTGKTYNPRDIRCKVGIKGLASGRWSKSEFDRLWSQVTQAIVPNVDGTLVYINGNNRYTINCYPQELAQPERVVGEYYRMVIDFIADWPFWRGAEEHSTSIAGGETATINNPSGVEMPITVIFSGPASNVRLTNVTTGKFLRLAQSIADGVTLTVNTANYTATLSDGTRANYKLAANSEYFRLFRGDNLLEATSDGTEPVTVKYQYVYLGV